MLSAATRAVRMGARGLAVLAMFALPVPASPAGPAAGASEPARLRLVTENFVPYTVAQGADRVSGPAADLVRQLMARARLPYSLEVMPWARAYATAASDASACVFSTVRSPAREADFEWIGPLVEDYRMAVFARADDPRQPDSLEALHGAVLGGFLRSATAEFFRNHGFELDLSVSDDVNPRKLLQKRFDYWVAGKEHGRAVLAQQGLTGRVRLVFEFDRSPMWLACNRQLPAAWLESLRTAWQALQGKHRAAPRSGGRP